MAKINCWEFTRCGREQGGVMVAELGMCPAATENRVNGLNEGKNGGRVCWAIAGTFCKGEVQGTFILKMVDCMNCDFFKLVAREQGTTIESVEKILELIE